MEVHRASKQIARPPMAGWKNPWPPSPDSASKRPPIHSRGSLPGRPSTACRTFRGRAQFRTCGTPVRLTRNGQSPWRRRRGRRRNVVRGRRRRRTSPVDRVWCAVCHPGARRLGMAHWACDGTVAGPGRAGPEQDPRPGRARAQAAVRCYWRGHAGPGDRRRGFRPGRSMQAGPFGTQEEDECSIGIWGAAG